MLRPVLAIAILSLTAHQAAFAAKPGFKCSGHLHEAEQLICQDNELAQLDNDLARLYNTLMKHLPSADQKRLRTEQSGWVKGRNDCWKDANPKACIRSEYEARINTLKDR
jgi:uncharacterized protein